MKTSICTGLDRNYQPVFVTLDSEAISLSETITSSLWLYHRDPLVAMIIDMADEFFWGAVSQAENVDAFHVLPVIDALYREHLGDSYEEARWYVSRATEAMRQYLIYGYPVRWVGCGRNRALVEDWS